MSPSADRPPSDRSPGGAGRAVWQRWTTPYDTAHPDAAAFRSLQVQATIALTPWAVLANWANLLVTGWTFRDTIDRVPLVAWMLTTAIYAAAGMPAWRRWRRGHWPRHISPRPIGRATRHAVVLALLWALPVALVYAHIGLEHRPLVVGITVGMICAGGFALFPMPRAAFGYVAILTLGMAAAFWSTGDRSQWLASTLLVGYSGIVLATVVTSSRQLGGRLIAEAESQRQKRVVDMLLDDFQDNARDWLWEIDEDGALCHVSPRLAEVFGMAALELEGRRLLDLLDASATGTGPATEGRAQLARALTAGTAFRDLHVSSVIGGQHRWWALSGKRLFNESRAATGWRGVGTDVTRSRQQKADLVRLANVDALTGLANRHQFRESLDSAAGRAFTLFYLDLDAFKAVNDLHGHQMGDRVLTEVALRFRGLVRTGDLLARIGGDEFALISWQTIDSDGAAVMATRLIDALRTPIALDDVTVRVGTGIGIVHAGPNEMSSLDMTRLADMALYEAKARGRNTYVFFHASMEEEARRRVQLIADLHGAVERGEFELFFQPLVSARTQVLTGAESLIRWNHPERGRIAPAEFVPLAEESGHIVAIGQWVLHEACRTAAEWPEHLRVAVNLSALQFSSPHLLDDVRAALAAGGLAAGRLEVEITESLVMRHMHAARTTLHEVRALGVRVTLDDFGTGYSSLSHLRALPIDTLKVDRAFIGDLVVGGESHAIVSAIVGLAKALRLTVTAEGVESDAQLAALTALGIDDAQGFLLARPMPADDFTAFMTVWRGRHVHAPADAAPARSA